jgi:Spy/CpxP family protein refolding chaperone
MDWINKNNVLKWLVIVLLAFNIMFIVFIWTNILNHKERPDMMKFGPPPDKIDFLQKELNLTDEQAQKFEEKRKEFFSASDKLFTEMNSLQNELTEKLLKQENNPVVNDSIRNQIGDIQAALEELRFNHFKELLSYCTPEQREKFIPIIKKITERKPPPDRKEGPGFPGDHKPGEPPFEPKDKF